MVLLLLAFTIMHLSQQLINVVTYIMLPCVHVLAIVGAYLLAEYVWPKKTAVKHNEQFVENTEENTAI
jgi:hypothetical protein